MRIFCSGIGGIGLSAYASHMKALGHEVSGSDKSESIVTKSLEELGITVSFVQDGSAVPDALDVFVYSEAIPETSPERVRAKELKVEQISYFAALGRLAKGTVICVCGTHGKSSTTAMAAKVLVEAGLNPSIVVGTRVKDLDGKNWRQGRGDFWLVEACEYRRSFLYLNPSVILMTNVDGDHFDSFKDLSDYESAFAEFMRKLPEEGSVIFHGKDAQSKKVVEVAKVSAVDADANALPELTVPGKHMQQNAQLVMALGKLLKVPEDKVRNSLQSFAGTWRRMEVKGTTKKGAVIIDDYAHHPTEILATLSALKSAYKDRKVICAFQPHTHDRALKLWNEFSSAFKDAGLVLVSDIYDARPDKDTKLADVKKLSSDIEKGSRVKTVLAGSLENTLKLLQKEDSQDAVLITMGAGDITNLSSKLLA